MPHSSDYPTWNRNYSEAMASLLAAGFLLSLLVIVAFCVSSNGKEISRYYITPDPETNCGENHEPCLTLDKFASENSNGSVTLILIPGHHNLTRNIEKLVLIISLFLLMAVSQSTFFLLL